MDLDAFLEKYYLPLKKLDYRFHKEFRNDERNPYQRDYSRVMYSTSFRRLQGKMQLLGIRSDSFYRNRLTHSFEVAEIARSIANILKSETSLNNIYEDDMYVLEVGALAHDIGNAPFGHHGERILNRIMKGRGGFEGNAQSLRILHKLEKKLPYERGLNLTLRSLLSIVKYYHTIKSNEKKFLYESDYQDIKNKLKGQIIKPRTVDVQIVDLADEIAYVSHDLEDTLSLKLFNIDEFMYEFENFAKENKESLDGQFSNFILKQIVENAKKVAKKANVFKSSEEYAFLLRKEITSHLVNTLILDIGVIKVDDEHRKNTGTENDYELGFKNHGLFVKLMKDFIFESVNRSDEVQLYEKTGEKVIKGIFEALRDEQFNKNMMMLPVEYRRKDLSLERNITDFISGMMDTYAINYYKRIYGENSLDRIYDKEYFGDYKYT